MVATFVARTGITTLKVGNPVLTLLEAVAQSELHSTEDVYRLLQSVSLDNATGDALINIAADEGLTPISATASTTIGTAVLPYTKTYTTIAAGGSVVAGQSVIPVVSTAGFAAGNTVYVGGTGSNRESRVIASAVAGTITLTLPLSNSHLAGEEIVKSNVGTDTTITARTAVQTSANGTSTQIVFYTAEDYTILDGENTLTGMTVYCSVPGTVGNVPAGAISTFKTPPVPGATFTNTLPASNGTDAETPEALRNRIRLARQSRSRGTAVAITNAVIGAYAADEGRTISAATIVPRTTEPSVLYVSDGSGYEEKVSAWTSETLTSSAVGGETYFKLGGGLPVAKAFLKSAVGPFSIVDGSELTVLVGGVRYVHTFADADFSDPEVATGYEVVASINGASGLGFAARTSGNGTYVVIYAKSEFNDDIEVIGSTGVDANEVLGFALGRRDTLILTKNDQLLSKDGKGALLTSAPQAEWDVFSLSSIIVMTLNVDGTGVKTFTLTTTDFGITPVTNSTPLDAWVRAINAKVTGVTAYKSGTQLVIESNSGRSARASLVISGTFVSNDIFTSAYGLEDYGQDSDFTLNRATGVIELAQPLVDGDSLLAGYRDLRAFVEATPVGTLAANSLVAFVLDEEIEVLGQGSSTIAASGTSLTMTLTGITTPLPSVATNDWVIVWGMTAFGGVKYWVGPVTISGSNGTLVIPELVTPTPGYSSGVYVAHVRCANKPIVVDVSGTTNATTFAAAINAQAEGCTAEVDGASVRVRANSFGESGSVTVVMNSNTNTGFYLGQTSANRLPVTVVESSVAAPVFGTFDRIAPADTGNQTELNAGVNIVQTSYGTPNADESFSLVSDISAGLNRNFTVASDASNPLRTLRQNDGTGALDATIVRKDAYKVGPEDTLSYSMASTPSVVQSLKLFTNATGNGAGGFTVDMTNTPVSTNFDFSDFALLAKPLSTGSTSPYVVRLESQVYGSQLEGYSFELQVPKVPTTSPTVVVDASNASDKKVYTTIGTTGASATDSTYYKLVSTTDESGLDYQTAIQYNFQIDTTGVSFTSSNEWSVPLIINLPTLYGTNPIKLNSLATAIQTQLNSFLLSVTGKYLALKLVTDENSFGSYVGLAAGATAAFQLKSTTVTVTRSGTTLTVTGLKFLKTPVTGSPSGSYLISGLIGFTSNSSANSLFTSMPTLDGDGVVVFGGTGKVSYASSELYSTKLGLPVRNNPYTVNGSIAASVTNTTYTYLTTNAALNTKAVINARLLPFGVQLSSTATSFLIPFQTAQIGTALPGTWYIQSSTYSSGLYTFTMKDSGFPSTYNVEAVLVPTTAKNVADIMSDSDRNADPAITADATSIGLSIYSNDFTDGVAVSGTGALSSQFLATASTNDYTTIETGSVPYMAGRYRLGQTSMINKVVSVAATALQTTFDQVWFNDQIVTPANSTTPVTHVAVSSVKASYNGYSQLFLATNLLSNFDQARNGDTCYIYDGSGPVGDGYYQIVNIVPGSTNTGRVVWIKGTLPVGNLTTTYMTVLSFVESILPTDSIVFRDQGEVGAVNAGVPLVVTGLVDAPTMSNLMINNVRKVTVNNVPANASGLFSSYSVTQTEALDLVATLDTCLYDANTDTAYVTFDEQDILPHETAPWAMVSMNKLNPTSSSQAAVPAYHYDTGIIQLANKITQGDEQDATNYPGYAAVNNQIVVAAPVIKRIVLGLQIRIAGGYANTGNANATQTSIINLVKSAVAAAVNSTPIGSFGVAFSDIVAAANSVPGVDGVVITSPTYNISNDSIPLQSFEKPMVLKLDDVSVSVLGG
jgi:hypothetical protein